MLLDQQEAIKRTHPKVAWNESSQCAIAEVLEGQDFLSTRLLALGLAQLLEQPGLATSSVLLVNYSLLHCLIQCTRSHLSGLGSFFPLASTYQAVGSLDEGSSPRTIDSVTYSSLLCLSQSLLG